MSDTRKRKRSDSQESRPDDFSRLRKKCGHRINVDKKTGKPIITKIGRKFTVLRKKIIELSIDDENYNYLHDCNVCWNIIVKDWKIISYYKKPKGVCTCGHKPIVDHYIIRNKHTSNTAIIGNVCIKHFYDNTENSNVSTAINEMEAIRRIIKDPYNKYVKTNGIIDLMLSDSKIGHKRHRQYIECRNSRKNTDKQKGYMYHTNLMIIEYIFRGYRKPEKCRHCRRAGFISLGFRKKDPVSSTSTGKRLINLDKYYYHCSSFKGGCGKYVGEPLNISEMTGI